MGNKQNATKSSETSAKKEEKNDHPVETLEHVVFDAKPEIKEEAYKIERQILENSGLQLDKEVWIDDVYIDYYGKNYLHTIRCGRPEDKIEKNLVIIHGYQGSSITFYKLFKHLYPKYNIFCPDIIGMALSSRPVVNFDTTEKWLEFFVESFEKWRQNLGIEKMHLVGHSLGGYFSALYSLSHPEIIEKLTLLSPAGITDTKKGGNVHEYMPFGKKLGFHLLGPFWSLKWTMQGMFQDNGLSKLIMKSSLRKRYEVSKEENELLARLTELSLRYPTDLDKSIYFIFKNPIPKVKVPLEDKLYEGVKSFKVDFYFGENDWMDRAGSMRLCNQDNERFKFYTVSKYGHNFNLENAEELAMLLLENDEKNKEKIIEDFRKKEDEQMNMIETEDLIIQKFDEENRDDNNR
jgi:abhydrolase domain-containing protein 5